MPLKEYADFTRYFDADNTDFGSNLLFVNQWQHPKNEHGVR